MKIKCIELNGFKSFSDKTMFPLHSGITCIVGPNGCGKSNIVDAFRWVLGEQSAKSLRGEKMEEVIFQGSAAKKQKGMAEVTLIISQTSHLSSNSNSKNGNGDGGDKESSDEISVSRRLYRSGESEYLINKRQCRLKDIKDIFLDTGLDVKSYSILDQGKIGEIINAKPLDRRFLIEEVAGVMKYKVRKAEAISKLESSKQNLQRINDIVYEVKRQINSLDRQVKKAERYKKLLDEIRELELRIAKREHTRYINLFISLSSEIQSLKETLASHKTELSSLENLLETKRIEVAEKEKMLAETENILNEKQREIADTEKLIAVLKTNIENQKVEIIRLSMLQEEIKSKKEELSIRIVELDDAENAMLSSMENISMELNEKKDWIADIELSIAEKETELENKRKELFKASELLSTKKNEIHNLQTAHATLKYRESATLKDINTIEAEIEKLKESIKKEQDSIEIITQRLKSLGAEKDAVTLEINMTKEEIENTKELLFKEKEALASNISRINSLKELIIDKSLTDFVSEGKGYKILSDIISADKDIEIAIESTLFDKINALIINDVMDIFSAVRIIKEKNIGRTAMFYAGFKNKRTQKEQSHTEASHDGIIGKVSDCISIENHDLKAGISDSFDNTYIAKDLQTAIELLGDETFNNGGNISIVTLDGEVIDSRGWIFAGHGKDILKKKREIKELGSKIDRQQTSIAEAESSLKILNEKITERKDRLKNIEDSIINLEKQLSLCNQSLISHQEDLQRDESRLSFLKIEISTIHEDIISLENLIDSKTKEISQIEKEIGEVNNKIAILQESISTIKAEHEDARSYITDLKLSLASYKEKIESIKRERENIAENIEELEGKRLLSIKDAGEAEQRIKDAMSRLEQLEEGVKLIVIQADNLQIKRADIKETITSENQEIISKGTIIRNIRAQIDETSQQISEINSKAVENKIKAENIEASIKQKYGIDINKATIQTDGFEESEDNQKLEELNEKIRELGPVNLGTIEEYEELKTRYDFLTRQQQDLTMSIAELEEAINRINTTTKRRLREAYETLKAKFSEVFSTLFGGGKADIILSDEENILESGIEIIAQPPGKKLQNINLLSGGEKALTSLAILFASFLIKPSPLCILDEVDAPLDESNTVRFAQMIKELSHDTQFIIITHNKTTMEVADYIYGITMEEPGVSKAVSLQLTGA